MEQLIQKIKELEINCNDIQLTEKNFRMLYDQIMDMMVADCKSITMFYYCFIITYILSSIIVNLFLETEPTKQFQDQQILFLSFMDAQIKELTMDNFHKIMAGLISHFHRIFNFVNIEG